MIRAHGTYGSPLMWEALQQQGIPCGESRVARLMRGVALQGLVVKVTRRAPGVQRFFEATPNLRQSQPAPQRPGEQWVWDVTCLKASGKQCFLATVMDVYSRRIVAMSWGRIAP